MTDIDLAPLDRLPGARQALRQVWSVLPRARLVGGVVRDLIAGRAIADIDLATPEPPETVMRVLASAGVRTVATGLAHGTVTALGGAGPGFPIEITTLRRDQETDGRHAVVVWTEDWREDAQRRDFTINAMSLDRDGQLFDYFEGAVDLAAGRVRFVGDPSQRIAEDALRILRFFRFQARYGQGAPDTAALDAITAAAPSLDGLSAERVWSEVRRILVGPQPAHSLSLMRGIGVLDRLLPGGTVPARLATLLDLPALADLAPDPVLRLAALLDGSADRVAHALRLSNAEAARLRAFTVLPAPDPGMDDASLRRLLADHPLELLLGRSWLVQATEIQAAKIQAAKIQAGSVREARDWTLLRQRLAGIPAPVFPLAGRDLLDRGVKPGPEMGRLLARIRDWWMAGGCAADRAGCLDRMRTLLDDAAQARAAAS